MTNEEVKDIIDNEGLGYAIQDYMSSDDFEDAQLAKLWDKASEALNAVTKYLGL